MASSTSAFGSSSPEGRHADDASRLHEAGDGVDVPVRVVVEQALVEPEDVLAAERVGEVGFEPFPLHAGVPVRVEQALLRGQERALSVDLDRAALEHHPERVELTAGQLADAAGHQVVAVEDVLVAPAVEREADRRDVALVVLDEDRRDVAHPDVAEGHAVEDRSEPLEPLARLHLADAARHQDVERLAARVAVLIDVGDGPAELHVLALGLGEHLRPELVVAGPGEPHGLVRLPLGRLAIARGPRRPRSFHEREKIGRVARHASARLASWLGPSSVPGFRASRTQPALRSGLGVPNERRKSPCPPRHNPRSGLRAFGTSAQISGLIRSRSEPPT